MQCQYAHENFSDYVAGQLDRALAMTLENHLNQCASCREEVAGLRQMWSLLDDIPVVDMPPYFHENLMHRLHTEMDHHAAGVKGGVRSGTGAACSSHVLWPPPP